MGNIIKSLLQIGTFIIMIGSVGWFVAFESDPYTVCKDHPKKKKTYFVCKPFNLEIKKPAPERKFRDGKF